MHNLDKISISDLKLIKGWTETLHTYYMYENPLTEKLNATTRVLECQKIKYAFISGEC